MFEGFDHAKQQVSDTEEISEENKKKNYTWTSQKTLPNA